MDSRKILKCDLCLLSGWFAISKSWPAAGKKVRKICKGDLKGWTKI